jgi:hypothetical protein
MGHDTGDVMSGRCVGNREGARLELLSLLLGEHPEGRAHLHSKRTHLGDHVEHAFELPRADLHEHIAKGRGLSGRRGEATSQHGDMNGDDADRGQR